MKMVNDTQELGKTGGIIRTIIKKNTNMWQIAGGITLGLWGFTITSAVVWFGIVISIFRG